jgi:hypothetical protein
MSITPFQARQELARRELEKRKQLSSPEDNENLLQKISRYGIKDPAIGLLNMGREFANLPHKVSGGRIPEFSPSDFDFGKTLGVENPEPADKLIQFAGQYAPAFALPGANIGKLGKLLSKIPKAGKYVSEAVSQAIPQALYSAAQAPQDSLQAGAQAGAMMIPFSGLNQLMQSTNPKVKTMAKLLGFGGAGLLGREAAKGMGMGEFGADAAGLFLGALGARGMDSVKDRNLRLSEGMNIPLANKKLKAAKRLGLDYLTPAEAGESQIAAGRQGALGRTEEGAQLLQNKAKSRVDSEARAIERTLNQIYSPGKMDEQVKNAYQAINQVNLPQDFPLQFKDNEIIKEAKRMVERTPAYKESLKELMPKNVKLELGQTDPQATSLVYWDHVKRAMDDMVSKAERAGNKNEARIISNTRTNMRDQMDTAYPEYKEARALYERKMVREGLEKVFDRKEINGSNFYQALASQKKFNEVISHLKNAPEAAQNLKDMRLVFKELLGPRTIKTAKGKEEYGMNQSRSSGAFLENMIEHIFTKGGSDKAAIEFITSPDWTKQLKEIKKISNKQMKMAALALTLSKGVAQYAGEQERKPMELTLYSKASK